MLRRIYRFLFLTKFWYSIFKKSYPDLLCNYKNGIPKLPTASLPEKSHTKYRLLSLNKTNRHVIVPSLIKVHLRWPCFQAVFVFEAGGGGKTSR